VAQSGTYSIDELLHFQVFEMTCNSTNKICRREETRKGGGPVPAPAGGQSTAGASMLEVNGSKKQLVVSLPVHWATFTCRITRGLSRFYGRCVQRRPSMWRLLHRASVKSSKLGNPSRMSSGTATKGARMPPPCRPPPLLRPQP
jgi:hypothetical protein